MGEIDDSKQFTRDEFGKLYDAYGNEMGASTTTEGSWWKSPLDDAKEREERKAKAKAEEEKQKEIDAIGTPGARTIDDLLAAFQKGTNDFLKNSEIDKLDDESWNNDVINTTSFGT
jgi:hypothetical protein